MSVDNFEVSNDWESFVNGIDSVSLYLSYSMENLNGSFSGIEEHLVIEICFSMVSSQSIGDNSN